MLCSLFISAISIVMHMKKRTIFPISHWHESFGFECAHFNRTISLSKTCSDDVLSCEYFYMGDSCIFNIPCHAHTHRHPHTDHTAPHTDKYIYYLNRAYELFINDTQFRYWFSCVVRVAFLYTVSVSRFSLLFLCAVSFALFFFRMFYFTETPTTTSINISSFSYACRLFLFCALLLLTSSLHFLLVFFLLLQSKIWRSATRWNRQFLVNSKGQFSVCQVIRR